MVFEEISVIVTLVGPLAAGDQLHRGVDEEGINQGLKFKFTSLSGMAMLGLGSVKVYPCQRTGQSPQGGIRDGLIHREMRMRNIVFDMAISGEECSRAYQNYGIPLEVVLFERPLEEKLLIFSDPDDTSLHKPRTVVGVGWSIGGAVGRSVGVKRLQSKVACPEVGYGSYLLGLRRSSQKRRY